MAVILLDTNVLSELLRPAGTPQVIAFVKSLPATEIVTAAVCEAELRFGIARLPSGRRRADLETRVGAFFAALSGQVLSFDSACAIHFAEIRAARERAGLPIPFADALVAATARANAATIATRNVGDFAGCGAPLLDPWATG